MNTLTVARHTEDVGWTAHCPDWYVHVVQKDVHVPNVGREPTSFVWSIVDLYDAVKPDDRYAFVQGDPFPHAVNLAELLSTVPHPDAFTPLSHAPRYVSDANGYPHHGGLDVSRWYERIHAAPMPNFVDFWPGGQFMVPGRLILQRTHGWWADLLTDLLHDTATSPWAMERLWPSLFAESPSLVECP